MRIQVVRIRPRRDAEEPLAALLDSDNQRLAETIGRFDDVRDRDLRGEERRFVVEGERVVRRFLRSRFPCESILATEDAFARLQPILEGIADGDLVVFLADHATMTSIAGYRLHGGCLAIGRRTWWPPTSSDLLDSLPAEGRCVVLAAERVSHVDNVGAMFRSAACLGASAVLLDGECADPLLRKPIRFSMGRVFDLPWGVSRDLPADLARLRDADFLTVALELTETSIPLRAMPRRERVSILVGSEGHGLSAATRAACDLTCSIPAMPPDEDGEARSLNVGVAAAIALYELARDR